MRWARAALLGEDRPGLENCGDQRFLHAAVGGEERDVLAVLGYLPRHVLQDELLSRREAALAHRVRSGHEDELHPEFLTLLLHQVAPGCQVIHGHVARERVVQELLSAQLLGQLRNGLAAGRVVRDQGNVGFLFHNGRILMRFADHEQDVGPELLDLADGGHGARHSLVDHDRLDGRIGGKAGNLSDVGLLLGHEVIGIRTMLEHSGVLGDDILSSTVFILAL